MAVKKRKAFKVILIIAAVLGFLTAGSLLLSSISMGVGSFMGTVSCISSFSDQIQEEVPSITWLEYIPFIIITGSMCLCSLVFDFNALLGAIMAIIGITKKRAINIIGIIVGVLAFIPILVYGIIIGLLVVFILLISPGLALVTLIFIGGGPFLWIFLLPLFVMIGAIISSIIILFISLVLSFLFGLFSILGGVLAIVASIKEKKELKEENELQEDPVVVSIQ